MQLNLGKFLVQISFFFVKSPFRLILLISSPSFPLVLSESAWRGITRSHKEVWEKWYGRDLDPVGGPDAGAQDKMNLV